ncbi:MAG TPA: DNA primase [Bacteroidia bacterium]|nr:DNA primase [Bacteroidota bacterium]HQW21860.1 DNA primase [Bacteroidia bacterium]
MITKETIDRIFETVRIEDVVGDFVQLKKRGVNYLGLCPFHNEKTPSFNVNPVRNIYKCFGCGKGGNAVNFIMELEHYTYPEALKFLAKKYSIEIEESVPDPKEIELRDERESLYILNSFASKTFAENLFDNEEGKAIGLSYFHERGFSDETIRKFELGYSLADWSAFSEHAIKNGYKSEFIIKTGLGYPRQKDGEVITGNEKLIDRFRGRVMFPIHNLSGRIIAFGGRILKKDDKAAKYVNSPESDIYFKSKSLYGIFFAKKAIVQKDNCYLVEGYTDVISLHQSGIENVVASSGTSLTVEQIRLIGRYTKNITVLYDGDAAGIKASLRGIDLILEEGLNVKVALFPDGDDPDSYSRKHGGGATATFIQENAKDFIVFKTNLLLSEVANDPIRKAGLIRDIVETISKIPDPITRSVYIKQSSAMMDIEEQVLIAEMNKSRKQQLKKDVPGNDVEELMPDILFQQAQKDEGLTTESQEKNIIRLLLNFGNHDLHFDMEVEDETTPEQKKIQVVAVKVFRYIVEEINTDEITFEHRVYNSFLKKYTELLVEQDTVDPQVFLNSENPDFSGMAVELLSPRYFLSENWGTMHKIIVPEEESVLKEAVENAVIHLKNRKIQKMIEENQRLIKEAHERGDDCTALIERHMKLEGIKMELSKALGIDILR